MTTKLVGNSYFLDRNSPPPRKRMFRYREAGKWVHVSAVRLYKDIGKTVTLLKQAGLKKGDKVVLVLQTSYAFALIDWAARALGVVTIPIHSSTSDEERKYIIEQTQPKLIFSASGANALESLAQQVGVSVPVWAVNDPVMEADRITSRIASLAESNWDLAMPPEQLVTIVYTSGTTGVVRGVKVTAGQIDAMEEGAIRALSVSQQDRLYLFLPCAHIFGRLFLWVQGRLGYEIALAPDYNRIQSDLVEVQPTVLAVVPRVLEKMYEQMTLTVRGEGGMGQIVWEYAVAMAIAAGQKRQMVFPLLTIGARMLLDRWVYKRVRSVFGGNLRYVISGGAALNETLNAFYLGAGLEVLQGYGLTETTGVICVSRPGEATIGTVGEPINGAEFKIDENGQICVRGPMVFRGYFKDRSRVLDKDGWYPTGDLGLFNAEGQLRITGRAKEILVLANGKNVSPIKIEKRLEESELIDRVVVIGDDRQYATALISVNPEVVRDKLNRKDIPQLAQDREVHVLIEREVERVNRHLGSYESVKYFKIVPRAFSTTGGELTSTLKLKRDVIARKYADMIDEMYPESLAPDVDAAI